MRNVVAVQLWMSVGFVMGLAFQMGIVIVKAMY